MRLRRMIEVFCIRLKDKEISRLYSRAENACYPRSLSISIEGDLVSLLCNGTEFSPDECSLLVIIDVVKDQTVFANIPDMIRYLILPVSVYQMHFLLYFLNFRASRLVQE